MLLFSHSRLTPVALHLQYNPAEDQGPMNLDHPFAPRVTHAAMIS